MSLIKNKNQKFVALPRTANNTLAELPCEMCDDFAALKVRKDGWIEIRCNKDCGYTEIATAKPSFDGLMKSVMENGKTIFRRCSRQDVVEALGGEQSPELTPEPSNEPEVENISEPDLTPEPDIQAVGLNPVQEDISPVEIVQSIDTTHADLYGE